MIDRMARWLGYGTPGSIGLQFQTGGVYLAVTRPPGVVVGVGLVRLPPGTVVGSEVRRPDEAASAVVASLSNLHWRQPPSLWAAIEPVPRANTQSGRPQPGIVTAAVYDQVGGENDLGAVPVAEPVLSSVTAALQMVPGVLRAVEPTPVSVARFLRVSEPTSTLRFVRSSDGEQRWTLCDGLDQFEVETSHQSGRVTALVAGPDPARMETIRWGRVLADRLITTKVAQPDRFVPAIGAALAAFTSQLSGDLLGPGSDTDSFDPGPLGQWELESIR